jgi:hypothetical protein
MKRVGLCRLQSLRFNLQEFGGSVGHPRKKRESRFVGVGVGDTDFNDYYVLPNRCDFLRGPVCARLKLLERLERLELI